MTMEFRHTRYACYIGYITQAIINNFLPLLFLLFQIDYGLSYERLGSLILLNFFTQLVVDLLAARFGDRLGYRPPMVAAHILCAAGLCLLAAAPLLPVPIYGALMVSVVIYAIGGGLLEVLVSPLVDSLPAPEEEKGANMSLLHSFYCWGQMGVVAVSTLILWVIGGANWQVLPLMWALVPLCNAFLFARVPMTEPLSDEARTPLRQLFSSPAFLAAMLLMLCSGASELTVSQWSSMFAEQGLGVSKVLGDLMGPCLFALLMGIGRTIYGVWGSRIRLIPFMTLLSGLCVICYLVISLAPHPAVSLAACAICGFSVSIMWPGSFSLTAARFPAGGTAMFAIMAMCGDLGGSVGPWLAGAITDRAEIPGTWFHRLASTLFAGGDAGLKVGLLLCTVFPVLLLVALPAMRPKDE